MGAINQYIDLFDANADALNAGSAGALNSMRATARKAVEGRQLPDRNTEGYEKTSIEDMYAPDFGVNVRRMSIPVDVAASFRCDIPNVSTLLALVVNDSFRPTASLLKNLPEGVEVMSLAKAAKERSDIIWKYYGQIASLDDTAVALNTMLAQDGVFIHLHRGVKLNRPLQVVNIFSSPTPLLAPRRVLLIAEERSEAELLLCDHTQDNERPYLSSQVIEVFAGRDSRLGIYDIEESSPLTARDSHLYARQEEGSQLTVNGSTLVGGTTRNAYDISLEGRGAEIRLSGMAIGTGKMHTDNYSSVVHHAEHCHSDQLFKYVLDDDATGAFEGSITVTPQGRFTEAYQSNRNILASTRARMHTKPQLLIYNDDVKCSHGATTGQLDQNALFYMRTRGIPLDEARTMLMQAFMVDVIDTVRLEGLRDRLRHLVEKRFIGERALCSDCKTNHTPRCLTDE